VLHPLHLAEELLCALISPITDALRQALEAHRVHKVLLVRQREDLLRRTQFVGLGIEMGSKRTRA